ncbi:hypothetical protein HMPREF1141_1259 [Clostridium sp. MSTE9]|nr:hypothetical protein HMPREF1141_1259 [Clostridium sp. MSTE9]
MLKSLNLFITLKPSCIVFSPDSHDTFLSFGCDPVLRYSHE